MRMRDEAHYGTRVVRCYADRPPHVDHMFRQAASARPQAVAVVDGQRRMTYGELDARVDRIAANLAALGARRGDRVALILGNRIEFIEVLLAIARIGAISVPIGTRQQRPENEYVIAHSGAKALIFEAELADRIPERAELPALEHRFAVGPGGGACRDYAELLAAAPEPTRATIGDEDVLSILYTSGTTGRPKGAMLTHLGAVHSCLHYRECLALGAEDASILAVPASHVTGLIAVILTMVLVAGRTVILPGFRARAFLELASAEGMTHTVMVPAMYNLCLLDPEFARFDLSQWRIGGYGGAPMPEATIRRLAEKLPRLILSNLYGATETVSPTTIMPLGEGIQHADSVGLVVPCGELRIMDDSGRELAAGEPGEIWIAGPMVVPGYWQNPDADRANFVGGFWKSGDIGSKDEAGYVRVFDRKKDMINRGGYKVYSVEVENILVHHPAILECAVVAEPDPVLGEKVHAFIVPKSDVTEAELRSYCATRIADYKVPERMTFLPDALPRNANGKVVKTVLKERLGAAPADPPAARS